jgi:23S rRNA pseudouridine955/2504/2580 synthase
MLLELKVSRNDAGQRAERYLRRRFADMALDRLHSLFRRKEIKIARKPIKRSHLLEEGDVIQVYGLRPEDAAAAPGTSAAVGDSGAPADAPASRPRLGIPIVHEDAELLVLDKPGNVAVHPGTGIATGDSVIEKARAYLAGERTGGELFQPSLVHRLDKDTSGVLVIAKTGESLRKLTEALRDGRFTKKYLALVEGVPDPRNGEISGLLQRVDSRGGGAKAEVSQDDGKWSVTRYKTVKDFGNFSLLGVIIETGRMHQIRAHLASRGHPLVGDPRYGSFERNRGYRKTLGLKRTFLHASDLEIDLGPGRKLAFHAPLPKDLAGALEKAAAGREGSA